MKILIVNTFDIEGGAARASYRLHNALLSEKIDSKMLVHIKTSDDATVIAPTKKIISKIRFIFENLLIKFYKKHTKTLFSPLWLPFSSISEKINEINPDIVHFHWISGGMLNIDDISKIKAPIVWSLHDMWVFTGGCHYDEECGNYKVLCGECKVLGSTKKYDLSRKVFLKKQKLFSNKKNITFIGLSQWITNCARDSTLLKDKKNINIPNPIDTTIFKPIDKNLSRELWCLPKNKKLILFGAMGATSDPRKGFKELTDSLKELDIELDIEFVVFGSSRPENNTNLKFKTHYLGNLHDDISLITLYNAVDVMIVPSIQENLSNAIMESLSCGTPVVAFNIGGNSDMIEHLETGYLAKPFDSEDLAKGIKWILNHQNYNSLCKNARQKILEEFDSVLIAKRYIELYENILKK